MKVGVTLVFTQQCCLGMPCHARCCTRIRVQKELVPFTWSQRWDWVLRFPLPSKQMGFCCWLHWHWDISTLAVGWSESAAGTYKYRTTYFYVAQNLKGLGLRNRVSLYGKKIYLTGMKLQSFCQYQIGFFSNYLKNVLNAIKDSFCLYFIAIRSSISGLQCFLRSCRGMFPSFQEG